MSAMSPDAEEQQVITNFETINWFDLVGDPWLSLADQLIADGLLNEPMYPAEPSREDDSSLFCFPFDPESENLDDLFTLSFENLTTTMPIPSTSPDSGIFEASQEQLLSPKTTADLPPADEAASLKGNIAHKVNRSIEVEIDKSSPEVIEIIEIDDDDDEPTKTKKRPKKRSLTCRSKKRRTCTETPTQRAIRLQKNRDRLKNESPEKRADRLAKQRIRDAQRRLRKLQAQEAAARERERKQQKQGPARNRKSKPPKKQSSPKNSSPSSSSSSSGSHQRRLQNAAVYCPYRRITRSMV